jgi:5'-3' exonuclease
MPKLPPKNGSRIERKNTLLIDGNALFKRGYLGSHDAYTRDGEHIGGLYQFITVTKKLISENVYHNVYVFWDGRLSGKLRYDIYKDYKSSRGKDYVNGTEPEDMSEKLQQYMVKGYLYHLSIKQLEDDVVEADDFIAYYCLTKSDYEDITICTSDRDLCQLISNDIRVYLCDKKMYVGVENYNTVFEHHYTNVALLKTIIGDNSDDIKGVKGVKEKTLLKHFPILKEKGVSLHEIIAEAQKLSDNRVAEGKKPLSALTNILNSVTDGVQGKKLYEINDELVNLRKPKLTEDAKERFLAMKTEPAPQDADFKEVYQMVKRDGLDELIREYYMSDYFLQFKKLKDRNN